MPTTRRAFAATLVAAALAGGGTFCLTRPSVSKSGLSATAGEGEGVEFSSITSSGQRFTVCRVDLKKARLQLFHSDESGKPFNRFQRLEDWLRPQKRRLVFAMNAGMFHPGFSPVGLLISDGKTLFPLNTADGHGNFFLKPNGVLAVTGNGNGDGTATVVETSEFPALPAPIRLATQSGPLLVHAGKIHPAFNAHSTSRLIRNGVGVTSGNQVVFAISDGPVNFHEFATLFRDTLHCPDALFLDGTISSLHAPALKRQDNTHDLGPIIAITAPL